ncbi:MAG: DUF5665 domain-containing protein [Thermovenabulum sp.]|uniref:DUF5665 domain-containing protein n=1 Tax=Thermovenabulum sp. TaxID=3100335 RepID=UPI003C7CB9D0
MSKENKDDLIFDKVSKKMEELSERIEKLNLAEYLELYRKPMRLIYLNFLAGVARGFGMAIGFTLLGAFVIYILQKMVILKLPVIGDFIADIIRIVQNELSAK